MTASSASDSHPRLLPSRERIHRRASDLERYLNLWRVGVAAVLELSVAVAGFVRGYSTVEDVWTASVLALYGVAAILFHVYLARRSWDDRMPVWVSAADVVALTAMLAGLVVLDRALAAVNSQLVFCGYFLVIAMAGLRSDPRVARMIAVVIPASYAAMVFLAVAWRHVELAQPDPQFGSFKWEIQAGRLVVLTAVTWMTQVEARLSVRDRAQASLDPLTGVFNRRYMEEILARELPRTRRRQQPFSLLVLDLDGFKGYNDTYGHLAGDRLLTEVASSLANAIRAGDVIARYGGDEFVIILPHTPGETARRVARELMAVIPASVTMSVGVGCIGQGVDSVERLLGAADAALHRAKSAGPGVVAG